MHFAYQAQRQRQPTAQSRDPVIERSHVSTYFARIVYRHAGLLVDFIQEQICQRGCVPSICDESTASLRTKLYRSNDALGKTRSDVESSPPTPAKASSKRLRKAGVHSTCRLE